MLNGNEIRNTNINFNNVTCTPISCFCTQTCTSYQRRRDICADELVQGEKTVHITGLQLI